LLLDTNNRIKNGKNSGKEKKGVVEKESEERIQGR
jgi:hypothetical protein